MVCRYAIGMCLVLAFGVCVLLCNVDVFKLELIVLLWNCFEKYKKC